MKHAVKHPFLNLPTLVLSLAFGSAFLFGAGTAGIAVAGDAKCTIAIKGDSPTAKACTKGGRKEAKLIMNQMVKTANTKGGKFTCDGCHKDLDSFELTPAAVEQYKKLQAASGIK